MSGPGRRALLTGALALPLAARAQDAPTTRLRISLPARWSLGLSPILAAFGAARPDLLLEISIEGQDTDWVSTALQDTPETGHSLPDIAFVGAGALALGRTRGLWHPLASDLRAANAAAMGDLAAQMRPLIGEEALVVTGDAGGPFLVYRPSVLAEPPRSVAALLRYARQNPGRFLYPRPFESALGQQFVMALPHLIRDRDPSDAQNGWTLSWAWLRAMGRYIPYYPSQDLAALQEFAEGGVDLMPLSLGSFLQGRMRGLLTEDTRLAAFNAAPTIPRSLFLVVPNHVPAERLHLIEALAGFLQRPEMQALAFGRGELPGEPTLGLSGPGPRNAAEQATWNLAWPIARDAMAGRRPVSSLPADQLAFVLHRWDERVGAPHGEGR